MAAVLTSSSFFSAARADYEAEVLSESPIAYYRFNDAVTVDDLPSAALNLGSVGATGNGGYAGTFVRGVGGALPGSANTAVQGSNTIVEIPYNAALNTAGSFTVEAWLKPTAIPAAGALISPMASFRESAGVSGDAAFGRRGWLIYQGDAATGFNFRAYNRNASNFTFSLTSGAGSVTAGAWHHVVVTWDSTAAQGKIYVNGVLKATSAVVPASGENTTTYVPNDINPISLGSRGAGAFPWSGDIDEPAYYTTALSDAQVLAHYNNGINPSPSPSYDTVVLADAPAGYWRLGEAAFVPRTPPVADNVGTLGASADGGYYAGSKNATTGPAPSSGFLGFGADNSCLSLATANGHVGTPNPGLLNGRTAFTVMGWVKRGAVKSTRGGYFGQNDLLEFGDADNGTNIEAWVNVAGTNIKTPYAFADNTWGFIVLTGDGITNRLYLDGQLAGTINSPEANYGTTAFPFNIGGGGIFAGTGDYFRGEIDEVAIFDKAVTAGRVKQLFDAAKADIPPTLADLVPVVTPIGDIPEGQPYSLTVDPSGTPPFSFQWRRNGVDIPGATSQTYTVPAAVANSPDPLIPFTYTVVISNGFPPSVTSDPVDVYVTPALKWTGTDGTNPGTWAVTGGSLNWKTYTAGTPAAFSSAYAAVFDDSGTATTVTLTEPVEPKGVVFENDTKDYTLTGAFSLATAAGGIVKNGAATTVLDVDDLFVDKVAVNEGTLKLGTGLITGLYANATVAVNGGTLEIGLPTGTPYSNVTTVASGATVAVTGTGDLSLSVLTGGFTGAGSEVFNRNGTVVVSAANTVAGTVTINTGTVAFDGSQQANRLQANKVVTVNPGATMEMRGVNALPTGANSASPVLTQATLNVVSGNSAAQTGGSHAHLKNITLDGSQVFLSYSGAGGVYSGESFQLNGNITVAGTTASTIAYGNGGNPGNAGIAPSAGVTHTITVPNVDIGPDLTISAELENTDSATPATAILAKVGVGTLRLADGISHTFSGTTEINEGTLEATGSIAGPLVIGAFGTIVPEPTSAGTFTAGATTLGGTFVCQIDGASSDSLVVNGDLVLQPGAVVNVSMLSPATAPFYEIAHCTGTLSGSLPTLAGTPPPGYALRVASGNSLLLAPTSVEAGITVSTPTPSGTEDFETSGGGFTVSAPVSPQTDWTYSNGHWLSFGQDAGTAIVTHTSYLSTPIYSVTQAGPVTMSVSHKYAFEEAYDAGAIDISVNGAAFTRLPNAAFTQNGYDGTLPAAPATNSALAGQEGFLVNSDGYPAYFTSIATLLANAAVGDTIQVRFMSASDDAFSPGGWEIDSFSITGALPNLMQLEWPFGVMQYSNNLQPPWTDLSGSSPLLIDTKAAPRRFFRVKP